MRPAYFVMRVCSLTGENNVNDLCGREYILLNIDIILYTHNSQQVQYNNYTRVQRV